MEGRWLSVDDIMSLQQLYATLDSTPGDNIGFLASGYAKLDFTIWPKDAICGIELDADGSMDWLTSDGTVQNHSYWATGTFTATDYDVRLEDNDGGDTLTSGSLDYDTWYQMSTTRAWYVTVEGTGEKQLRGTLEIRPTGGGADIDTASCVCTATCEP